MIFPRRDRMQGCNSGLERMPTGVWDWFLNIDPGPCKGSSRLSMRAIPGSLLEFRNSLGSLPCFHIQRAELYRSRFGLPADYFNSLASHYLIGSRILLVYATTLVYTTYYTRLCYLLHNPCYVLRITWKSIAIHRTNTAALKRLFKDQFC